MDNQSFRDMCAAMAMQGDIARSTQRLAPDAVAARAFDIADAMAAERERRVPFIARTGTAR